MSIERRTIFNEARTHRFTLWRDWSEQLKPNGAMTLHFTEDPHPDYYIGRRETFVQFIGLNPSTADEIVNDRTVSRCIAFAQAWGFGALCMTNLFAFRTKSPKIMKVSEDPIGGETNTRLLEVGMNAGLIIAAWGKDGVFMGRQGLVKKMFLDAGLKLHHLGLNGDGTPKHPLYLKKTTQPTLWV